MSASIRVRIAVCTPGFVPWLMAGGTLYQVDQAASADQTFLRYLRERGECADMYRRLGIRAVCTFNILQDLVASAHMLLQILSVTVFVKIVQALAPTPQQTSQEPSMSDNQLNQIEF